MKIILNDDNLEVNSEVEVCEMLMKWLQVQTEGGHEVHPEELLPLIRWSGISVDYVKSKLLRNTTLTSDPASVSFLSKVISYLVSGVQFEDLRTFHRPSTGLSNNLILIGLCDVQQMSTKMFHISLQQRSRARKDHSLPFKVPLGSAAHALSDVIYSIGIGPPLHKEIWKWDVVRGWFRCADMITGRRSHCALAVDATLYVFGGIVGVVETVLSSVESYNTRTNKWFSAGQLIHAVYGAACATYNNCIYVFGGRDKDDHFVDHVQVYKPGQETCTLMGTSMPRAYNAMRAMLWETSVILLNRYTCFIYNFETQTWQEKEQFKTGVAWFASTLDSSTVYIAGGGTAVIDKDNKVIWTYTDEIKSVSVLDIIANKPAVWTHHAKLPRAAMIDSFVNIFLPALDF